MVRSIFIYAAVAVFFCTGTVAADVLWEQPKSEAIRNIVSQVLTDTPNSTLIVFDDFTTSQEIWEVTRVTIYGTEEGDPSYTEAVKLAFTTEPNITAIGTTFDGVQVGNDLVFDIPGGVELSGDFWLTAWIQRAQTPGWRWFWRTADYANGSQLYFHGPVEVWGEDSMIGESLLGAPFDLSFMIEGSVVPEGSSFVMVFSAVTTLAAVTRYRRSK